MTILKKHSWRDTPLAVGWLSSVHTLASLVLVRFFLCKPHIRCYVHHLKSTESRDACWTLHPLTLKPSIHGC